MVRFGSISSGQTPVTLPPLNSSRESRPESLGSMAHLSNLLRMAPLQLGEIPTHPDLPDPAESALPKSRRSSAEAVAETTSGQQAPPNQSTDGGHTTAQDSANLQKTFSHVPFPQPDLQTFVMALLDDGMQFLSEPNFSKVFSKQDSKSAAPHPDPVEVYSYGVAMGEVAGMSWSGESRLVQRSRPRQYSGRGGDGASGGLGGGETWFARRSLHDDIPSQQSNGTSACWDEFVFGLRDDHSKHEQDFTPTLYDCHQVASWAEGLTQFSGATNALESPKSGNRYTHVTMGIYEMCHKLPFPLNPRCFSVLVATASVTEEKFIAVTVPVTLNTSVKNALYSVGKNKTEGQSAIEKKDVVMGNYAAVEIVRVLPDEEAREVERRRRESNASTGESKPSRKSSFIPGIGGGGSGSKQSSRKPSAEALRVEDVGIATNQAAGDDINASTGTGGRPRKIEWTMATASDARGVLPTKMQEMGIPGAIAKDVSYFLKWIKDADRGKSGSVHVQPRGEDQVPEREALAATRA